MFIAPEGGRTGPGRGPTATPGVTGGATGPGGGGAGRSLPTRGGGRPRGHLAPGRRSSAARRRRGRAGARGRPATKGARVDRRGGGNKPTPPPQRGGGEPGDGEEEDGGARKTMTRGSPTRERRGDGERGEEATPAGEDRATGGGERGRGRPGEKTAPFRGARHRKGGRREGREKAGKERGGGNPGRFAALIAPRDLGLFPELTGGERGKRGETGGVYGRNFPF